MGLLGAVLMPVRVSRPLAGLRVNRPGGVPWPLLLRVAGGGESPLHSLVWCVACFGHLVLLVLVGCAGVSVVPCEWLMVPVARGSWCGLVGCSPGSGTVCVWSSCLGRESSIGMSRLLCNPP